MRYFTLTLLAFVFVALFSGCPNKSPAIDETGKPRYEQNDTQTLKTWELQWITSEQWFILTASGNCERAHSLFLVVFKDGTTMSGALAHCNKGTVTSAVSVTQGRIIASNDKPTLSLVKMGSKRYWVLRGPLGKSKSEFEASL